MDSKELTVEDIMQDPKRFGMPTFEEFKKDPDRFKGRPDELLGIADAGSINMKNLVRRHLYDFEGYECNSLEIAERVMSDEGLLPAECEMYPQIIPVGCGQCDIRVSFRRKRKIILPYE